MKQQIEFDDRLEKNIKEFINALCEEANRCQSYARESNSTRSQKTLMTGGKDSARIAVGEEANSGKESQRTKTELWTSPFVHGMGINREGSGTTFGTAVKSLKKRRNVCCRIFGKTKKGRP